MKQDKVGYQIMKNSCIEISSKGLSWENSWSSENLFQT